MFTKLNEVEERYEELNRLVADPEIYGNQSKYAQLNKERVELEKIVTVYRLYKKTTANLAGAREILEQETDEELREMAKSELEPLEREVEKLTADRKSVV